MAKTDRYLTYLADERRAGHLYRALAELTTGDRREALLELASIEDNHARHWAQQLVASGVTVPPDDSVLPPGDEDIVRRARSLSITAVLPELEQAERDAQNVYDNEPDAAEGMADDERIHEKVLRGLQSQSTPAPAPTTVTGESAADRVRSQLNRAEPWHRTDKSGSLRAAVFGVSDGLVSNTALVMGFAGSGVSNGTVLFAGLAGLLAGAFSMGAGEYVSVASQRDIFGREIALEAAELRDKPLEEQRELELIYRAKGIDKETARKAAQSVMADPDAALDTLAREELGLDPGELGSPTKVALSSFAAFAVGAVVPVIPYLFSSGTTALMLAIVLAALALVTVGGLVGRLSGLGIGKSAARQLLVGGGAAAVTYFLGRLVGTTFG
jgi:vacuolar iron transporter family protein